MSKPASLKAKIASGAQTIGLNVAVSSTAADLRRAMDAGGPYDYVYVDSQHSPFDEPSLVEFVAAADEVGLPVRLRIKHTRQAYLIGNLLDLGPTGVEVSQVESVELAKEAVDNLYYPPVGCRSYGGGLRQGAADFDDPVAYCAWWNDHGVLWLQVESLSATVNAHRWALPGVDCFSFGPTDLALDIQHHPNPPYATVEDCVQALARSVEGTGVRLSFRNHAPDQRQHWADLGVTVFLERPQG